MSRILAMASAIHLSRRPLADMRGIILDLNFAGFSAVEIHRYVDEAVARARAMQRLP